MKANARGGDTNFTLRPYDSHPLTNWARGGHRNGRGASNRGRYTSPHLTGRGGSLRHTHQAPGMKRVGDEWHELLEESRASASERGETVGHEGWEALALTNGLSYPTEDRGWGLSDDPPIHPTKTEGEAHPRSLATSTHEKGGYHRPESREQHSMTAKGGSEVKNGPPNDEDMDWEQGEPQSGGDTSASDDTVDLSHVLLTPPQAPRSDDSIELTHKHANQPDTPAWTEGDPKGVSPLTPKSEVQEASIAQALEQDDQNHERPAGVTEEYELSRHDCSTTETWSSSDSNSSQSQEEIKTTPSELIHELAREVGEQKVMVHAKHMIHKADIGYPKRMIANNIIPAIQDAGLSKGTQGVMLAEARESFGIDGEPRPISSARGFSECINEWVDNGRITAGEALMLINPKKYEDIASRSIDPPSQLTREREMKREAVLEESRQDNELIYQKGLRSVNKLKKYSEEQREVSEMIIRDTDDMLAELEADYNRLEWEHEDTVNHLRKLHGAVTTSVSTAARSLPD